MSLRLARSALRRARPAVWRSPRGRELSAAPPAVRSALRPTPRPYSTVRRVVPEERRPCTEQRRRMSFSYPAPRTLDEVVKIDLLQEETPDRVRDIWDEYHLTKEDVVGQAGQPTSTVHSQTPRETRQCSCSPSSAVTASL